MDVRTLFVLFAISTFLPVTSLASENANCPGLLKKILRSLLQQQDTPSKLQAPPQVAPLVGAKTSHLEPSAPDAPKPNEQFLHFQPLGADGGSRLHLGAEYHPVGLPAAVSSIELPEGYSFQTIYTWKIGTYSKDSSYQVVVGRGKQPVAQLTFEYWNDTIFIRRMETVPGHQRLGLSKALLKSVDALIGHRAKEVFFSVDYTNQEEFMKAFEAGASVEDAVATTPLGKYLKDSGYTLSKFAPTKRMKEIRPALENVEVPQFYEKVDHPYFWFTRE